MFLKSSTGAVKTVRNIDDLHAIGETMKLTYKTIAVENEDTDFQFYDRLLTVLATKSSKVPKAAQSATLTSTS